MPVINLNLISMKKTSMIRSNLCDCSDAYIHAKVRIPPSRKLAFICFNESPLK